MNNSRSFSFGVLLTILFFDLYLAFLLLFCDVTESTLTLILSLGVTVLSFVSIIISTQKTKSLLNQYNLFLISFFLFSFGQVYLYVFGVSYKEFDLMKKYQGELINKYLIFSIISLLSLIMMEEFLLNKIETKKERKESPSDFIDLSTIVIVFGVLFIISTPFYYSNFILQLRTAKEYGYGEIYELNNNALFESISMWHIPSVFALLYCNKDKKSKYLFLLFLLLPVIGYLYIGTRSRPMAILMCLIYMWNSSIKRFSKKMLLLLLVFAIMMLVVISTVSYIRNDNNRSMGNLFQTAIEVGVNDSIVHALGEFGGSMQIWIRLQHIIPENVDYSFGFSYLAAVLSCIPSSLLGGFSFANYSNLSVWITNIESADYGLGFSMLGEAYYNFGWFGAIFFGVIVGFVFFMLSGNWVPSRISNFKNMFATIALYIFATAGRGAMYLAIRYILYCMVIPIALIYIIDSSKKKKMLGDNLAS